MVLSFSRADPTSPASVAEASFPTSRRGFHPDEVRALLRDVAAELGRLQERERFLERELRNSQSRPPVETAQLDDETVTRLLGEETLRVLQTARESASQIKIKAEEGAARLLREAAEEANRLRNEATAAAEAELSLAKQQGREMVSEARAYRERVLSELTRRREAARQQIEQLVHGRERLLQVFERARLVAVDVVSDLEPIGEPDEYVDLTPTTGPVPMMVPSSALPRPLSISPSPEPEPEPEPEVEAELELEPEVEAEVEAEPEVELVEEVDDAPVEEVDEEPVEPEQVADTNVYSLFPETEAPAGPAVSQLFARLRAETESVVEPAVEEPAKPEPTETVFEVRDAALVPLIVSAARRLKRVLADEQNEVLDSLRSLAQVTTLDDLLPETAEHAARYVAAIEDELTEAHAVGVTSMSSGASGQVTADLSAVTSLVGDSLIEPLRHRLERCISDGGGESDQIARKVRAVYREWKTQHIDDQLDDVLRLAHGSGILAGATAGAPLCWAVDPDGPACPDAEDNSLAGPVLAGDPYPTGHRVAPAHAGCRCLLSRPAK